MKIGILDDWHDTLRGLPSFALLQEHDVRVSIDHFSDAAVLAEWVKDRDAVVLFRERTPITAELLEMLPNLQLISQRGVYPHIDIEACTQRGVTVCSKPGAGANAHATAELTFALILSLALQIPQQMASLQRGEWQMGVGTTLHGKRLGLWSFGRVGSAVAGYARAFGMDVLVHGSAEAGARAVEAGFAFEPDRARFFTSCDVVSLHLRAVDATRRIVTPDDLGRMKRSAILVNTSRASLIAPGALVDALQAGRPGYAALDVFDDEPMRNTAHPLLGLPNVVATPHIGFVTREELDEQFAEVYAQVNAFASGEPINVVTPETLA